MKLEKEIKNIQRKPKIIKEVSFYGFTFKSWVGEKVTEKEKELGEIKKEVREIEKEEEERQMVRENLSKAGIFPIAVISKGAFVKMLRRYKLYRFEHLDEMGRTRTKNTLFLVGPFEPSISSVFPEMRDSPDGKELKIEFTTLIPSIIDYLKYLKDYSRLINRYKLCIAASEEYIRIRDLNSDNSAKRIKRIILYFRLGEKIAIVEEG